MDEPTSRLEGRIEELSTSLGEVQRRLRRVEDYLAIPREAAGAGADADAGAPPEPAMDVTSGLSLTGRTLICLAGAYLPRALTAEGLLPEPLGAALGFAYAGLWIFMADRAGGRGERGSAIFHGATATLVGLPLIWETTTRFELLSPAAGAAALGLLAALSLIAARRRDLPAVAWIASSGAGVTALVLGGWTHAPVPYAGLLVGLGVATLWLSREGDGRGLAWITAALADLSVLLLWTEDPVGKGRAAAGGVLAVQLSLFALYALSVPILARLRRRRITIGAALQTAIAAAVGYGGAVAAAGTRPAAAATVGAASLALALAAYVAAFRIVAGDAKRAALFVSALAVPLLLGGGHLLLEHPARLWSGAAILCSWLGSRLSRLTLSGHATVYALIAAVASGLLVQSAQAWTASAGAAWAPLAPRAVLAWLAIVACLTFRVRGDVAFWGSFARAPKLLLLILGSWGGAGLLIRLAAPAAAGEPGAGADAAVLAAVRTAVLAASALLLAWIGRSRHLQEASWLVVPVLALGALKLVVEDFPAGRPVTLLVALALFGGALIAAPGLRRRGSEDEATETPVQRTGNGDIDGSTP